MSSTRSHNHSNDQEVLEDDVQVRLASSDAVGQEHTHFTTGTGQQSAPATTRTDAGPVGSISHGRSSRSSPLSRGLADTARSNLKRLSKAQKGLETSTSNTATGPSSSTDSFSSGASLAGPRERAFWDLKKEQEGVTLNQDGPPRFPARNDFPGLSIGILEGVIDVDVRNCVIILQNHSKPEPSLHSLALRLQRELPESVFILLQSLQTSSSDTKVKRNASQGEAEDAGSDIGFLSESRTILVDVIKKGLIAKCHFLPRNIIVLGHCQGGMAALTAAASWQGIEFGGVISIGGAIPASTPQASNIKAKTPALILSGPLGNVNESALGQIREQFTYVEYDIQRISNDNIPGAEDIGILLDFFGHRFRSEEWTKQAVISFDGGGIRGYGSLLILQTLMNKIGEEEQRLDPTVKSSFAPSDYKPVPENHSGYLDDSEVDGVVATATQGLPNSSLFLPCHYFTYAAGTSTGGLISIMLSRLRMTVDDCIKEYKTLGAKVFGNPRPLAKGAVMWHKFDCRTLEAVIKDVTQRYSEPGQFRGLYTMDEDVCKCMVLAYADNVQADHPYRFRTYENHAPPPRSRSTGRSGTAKTYGGAAALPIWQVARATSAAPTYFPPIKIPKGNMPGDVTFKDGGFGSNNPSEEAYNDIILKHGEKIHNMGPFISIGTGIPPINFFANKKGNLHNAVTNFKAITKHPSRTQGVHERMDQRSTLDNKKCFPYFRFDGGERLGEIALDEWKGHRFTWLTGKDKTPGYTTLEKMYVATAAYLAHPKVQQDLTECARILVRRRQLRMRDSSEWDRYASFSEYICNVEGCGKPNSAKAHEFREHLRKVHQKTAGAEVDQRVRDCRRVYWKYRPTSPDATLPAG